MCFILSLHKPKILSLGIVIKQSSISSVFTYLGTIIGFANTVILFPAFLSAEQIGLLRVIPSAAFMIMPLAQLGLGRTLVKFAPEVRKSPDGLANFTSILLIGISIGFAISSLIILVFRVPISSLFVESSPLLNDYLLVVIGMILVLALYTFMEAYGRIFLKIIFLNIVREILVRMMLSISVLLYFLKWITFHQMVLGLIIIYSTALALLIGYLVYNRELRLGTYFKPFDKPFWKRVTSYAGFSILGTGGGYVILNIDQVMITSLIGLDANGIYTTAFFFAVMIELSRRAITQITTPLVSEFFENKDLDSIKKIHQQISINQMTIGVLFFIGVTCNLKSIYALMPNGEIYQAGTAIVYLIGLSKLIDMTFSNNGEVITMSDHYRFNVISMVILAMLMIVFNFFLIPKFGINGAAMATLGAVLLYNVIKLVFIKKKLGFTPFTLSNLWLLLIGLFVFALGYFMPAFGHPILDVLIRSSVVTLIYGAIVYYLNISKEINSILNGLLNKIS